MAYYKCGKIFATQNSNTSIETASGEIASFNTQLSMPLLSCKCDFAASQASGTPTPSTPIPIVGVDKVNVSRCGKNLFDDAIYSEANWTLQENGYYNGNAHALLRNSRYSYENGGIKTSGVVTVSFDISMASGSMQIYCLYKGDNSWTNLSGNVRSEGHKTFTTNSDKNCIAIGLWTTVGQTSQAFSLKNFQVEIAPSETAYEPYNGTTALINLGGTYFGGSVDAVTGKITLTHAIEDLGNKALGYFNYSSTETCFYISGFTNKKRGYKNLICSAYATRTTEAGNWNLNNYEIGGALNSDYVYIKNTDYTSTSDLKTSLNGVMLVYELATPIVIYASNTAEIPTIVGDNQVFADTGDVEVKYKKII